MNVIIKEWKEFRVEIGANLVPDQTTAERKIRNYMSGRGYIVKQIIMRTAGAGAQPWVFDFRCFYNIEDFRNKSAKKANEGLEQREDIKDVTLN